MREGGKKEEGGGRARRGGLRAAVLGHERVVFLLGQKEAKYSIINSYLFLPLSLTPTPPMQHQKEEKRRNKEEAKARRSGVVAQEEVVKFKVERRVSSDELMLMDVSFL